MQLEKRSACEEAVRGPPRDIKHTRNTQQTLSALNQAPHSHECHQKENTRLPRLTQDMRYSRLS